LVVVIVSIAVQGLTASVRFAYDETLVEIIRSVPGRPWNAEAKRWTIPAGEVNGVAAVFTKAGCTVTVDGNVWTPPADHRGPVPSSRVALLTRMFESISARLTSPTDRALVRVWHPDTGGDHRLTQDLNEVWSRAPKGTT
jgi:hypothetical protein